MIREIKDLSRTVRVNSSALKEAEMAGWSTQRLVDWALEQFKKKGIKPRVKK